MPIAIQLEQVAFAVQPIDDKGAKMLLFQDPKTDIIVSVPLGDESAKKLASQLTTDGKIQVATGIPTPPMNREQRRKQGR